MQVSIRADMRDLELFHRKLDGLSQRVHNFTDFTEEAGQYMVRSIRNRILRTKTAPDGTRWADNSDLTIELKGRNSPLFETGNLAKSVNVADADQSSFTVAASADYAGYMQGGVARTGGRYKNKTIPARPFMGFSPANKRRIAKMLNTYVMTGAMDHSDEEFGG